ncbi:DUF4304 domain-containing protein [Spirosoma sp. BT702]|uniref:DUF4304 domain-containing protein n=1 Tax=Spirosoma profusum TaxID=2771354 RepID=A0A926Y2R2_9BACT|nr:DUF4304 domain-containing protein [Spirosoma profusum]MBD2703322.1 DUF4304 domain-containing protein [Spirosoma profusum]
MAQKGIKELVKSEIEPVIKSLGFKKQSNSYVKTEEGFLKIIGLQFSQTNTSEEASFTIECGIFFPELYLKCFDELPKYPKTVDCFFQYRQRIGRLKGSHDEWYKVKVGEDNQPVLDRVRHDLTWYVRRHFERYTSTFSFFSH